MSVQIKRLKQTGSEFVPITADEAVVVNASNIGLDIGITTLDKVLKAILLLIGKVAEDTGDDMAALLQLLNLLLALKQDKLTAGAGITIENDGTIHLNHNFDIYKIVNLLPLPSADCLNIIYIVPTILNSSNIAQASSETNVFTEYICLTRTVTENGQEKTIYIWEKLGEWKADIDLSNYVLRPELDNYVTKDLFNLYVTGQETDITTNYVTTSEIYKYEYVDGGLLQTTDLVSVSYELPNDLYVKIAEVSE